MQTTINTAPLKAEYFPSAIELSWRHIGLRYFAYGHYLKHRFGARVQKVSLDAGFTCPNVDGTVAVGGCYREEGDGRCLTVKYAAHCAALIAPTYLFPRRFFRLFDSPRGCSVGLRVFARCEEPRPSSLPHYAGI